MRNEITPDEILSLPIIDLIDLPWKVFGDMLRSGRMIKNEHLVGLDHVFLMKILRFMKRDPDFEAIQEESDGLGRLMPVEIEDTLIMTNGGKNVMCNTRWRALEDLLDAMAEKHHYCNGSLKDMLYAKEILRFVRKHPGCTENSLLTDSELSVLHSSALRRNINLLEANDLLRVVLRQGDQLLYVVPRKRTKK